MPITICQDYWNQPYWEIHVGVLVHEYMHIAHLVDLHDPYCDPEDDHRDAVNDPEYASRDPEAYRRSTGRLRIRFNE
jgi:hypothetical protein